MELPEVSVVIPAYNCGNHLARAIDSVLGQTCQPLECIIVNDGSTDSTAQVAESYGDKVTLIHQKNQGASSARNAGLFRAAGDYTAFLDADDYWHPSKLEKQLRLMREHPEVVLVSTGLSWYHHGESVVDADYKEASRPYSDDQVDIHSDLLALFRNPYLGTPTVMVRTDRAREVGGFDIHLPIAEDLDFYFRVCSKRTYAKIRQPLTVIEVREGSLTHTKPGYKMNLEVIDRVENAEPEFARLHHEEFNNQRLIIYRKWIYSSLRRGDGQNARFLLKESSKYGRVDSFYKFLAMSFIATPIRKVRRLRVQV